MQTTMLIDFSPFTHFHRFSFTFASLTRLLCRHYLGAWLRGSASWCQGQGQGGWGLGQLDRRMHRRWTWHWVAEWINRTGRLCVTDEDARAAFQRTVCTLCCAADSNSLQDCKHTVLSVLCFLICAERRHLFWIKCPANAPTHLKIFPQTDF